MIQINVYLTFKGNCKEAMTFYAACLGGDLFFQTIGESPLSAKMPKKIKNCILHSTLTKGALVIMGTDMVGENGLINGNGVSLLLNCSSEKEINNYFSTLSAGGLVNQPLQNNFFGAIFGHLTDKFGIHWLLNFKK